MSNRWLVEALQNLVVEATKNGCKLVSGEIEMAGPGMKFEDHIQFQDSNIWVYNAKGATDGADKPTT